MALGDNCLDVYLTWNRMTVGGNALNVAAQWKRSGRNAGYMGAIGTDRAAALVLTGMKSAGLSPDDVERRAGATGVTLLRHDGGERSIIFESLGVGEEYSPDVEAYAGAVASADWVHLGTNVSSDLVRRLVRDNVPFSVDISTAYDAVPLAGVPLVFASAVDADGPVAPLLAQLRSAGSRHVVVTSGRFGAYFAAGDGIVHEPAIEIEPFDTCGAGDSFIAEFVAAWRLDGIGVRAAMRRAARAAARTCDHLGGYPQPDQAIPGWLVAECRRWTASLEKFSR